MPEIRLREQLLRRHKQLKMERSSWDTLCKDVTTFLLPYAGRYTSTDVNRGDRRDSEIIDSSATRNARVLSAAMMAYANSQARPWFALTLGDPELSEWHPVKVWLNEVTERIHRVFHVGNTYGTFHKMYDELGAFGTAASIVRPSYKFVIHHHPVTNGQFYLADNSDNDVDTCYREFQMTVAHLVEMFGLERCSQSVKNAWNNGNYDTRFPVVHAIEPRRDRDPMRRDAKNKRWRSVYIELSGNEDQVLSESGFDRFPVLAPRWDVTGGDVYGNGPGIECLGHIKQLQQQQLRKAQVLDFKTLPALQGPTSLKDKDVERFPGSFTPVDSATPQGGIKEMWRPDIDLNHLLLDIQDVRQQIRDSFYTDLFLTFTGMNDTQKTAYEISARMEEKMLILGPVTSRLYREMHGPLIQMVFEELLTGGGLPPAPEELSGAALNVEYVSVLAQAQKAIGANSMDRFMFAVGQLYAIKPDVLDKVDTDRWVEHYANRLGIDPDEIVPGEQVALIREARDRANAAKEQSALMEQQANTMNALGNTPVGANTALDAVAGLVGYAGA